MLTKLYLWPKSFYVNEVILPNYHIQIILCLFFTAIIISYSVFGRTSGEMKVVAVPFCLIFPEEQTIGIVRQNIII